MKRVIKRLALLVTVAMMFGMTGCSGYTSSYKTTMCVMTNDSKSASLSFSTFEGSKSYKFKCKDSGKNLKYTGNLGKGNATVYYDDNGTKKELFTVSGDETVDSKIEGLKKGTVYVIIETDGKCEDGRFEFELE